MARPGLIWWYWLVTAMGVAGAVLGSQLALVTAVLVVLIQVGHLLVVGGSLLGMAAQIRYGFLLLLAIGTWPATAALHVLVLFGLMSLLVFGYCPLARTLVLMPWNRRTPLTWRVIVTVLLARPRAGAVWQGLGGFAPTIVSTATAHGDCPALTS